jgi:hypothetical protein
VYGIDEDVYNILVKGLQSELVKYIASPEGPQADVLLIEPNGDRHPIRFVMKLSGVELLGDPATIAYLYERYGVGAVAGWALKAAVSDE